MSYELYYSTGGHVGPFKISDAITAALVRVHYGEAWVDIRDRSSGEVWKRIYPEDTCGEWSLVWPTVIGWYWVYRKVGDRYYLETCRVVKTSNSIAHICGAQFLYQKDSDVVFWKPLEAPTLPERV